jgi:hypothetical protein
MSGRRVDELSCLNLCMVGVIMFVKWMNNAAILGPWDFGL